MPAVSLPWPRRGSAVPLTVLAMSAMVAFHLAAPIALPTNARLSWSASVLFSVGTIAAARHTVRRLPAGDPARRFWWAFAANAALIGVGYIVQLLTATDDQLAVGNITGVLGGLGAAVVVVVMLTYPLQVHSRREKICFWLDMATVMVGAAAFGWYFSSPSAGLRADLLSLLTGPVVMLVCVFAVAKLLISGRPPFSAAAGMIGAGAAVAAGIGAVLGPGWLAHGRGTWVVALSALGDALVTIAALVQIRQLDNNPGAPARTRRRPYSTLPYVALAGTFFLLSIALNDRGLDSRAWSVLAGLALCTALVVARQLAAFADNARLLVAVDTKVRELREAQVVLHAALRERDELADRLRDMAFHDDLTGLANRALFHDRLAAALARVRRHHGQVVVMALDLDDFKPINDRYGHAAGDAILRETAQRLRGCLRETDTVARLGGDEFAILLDDLLLTSLAMVAERIIASMRQPCVVNGVALTVGISVGIARAPIEGCTVDGLLHEADLAMYEAKDRGKNTYAVRGLPVLDSVISAPVAQPTLR